jgi:hypothetical protein
MWPLTRFGGMPSTAAISLVQVTPDAISDKTWAFTGPIA